MSGFSAYAHHSFTATYDENKTVEIEGELVQFMFRNPHAWVHVMAPDENGEMQRWGVEGGGAGALTGQGVTRESLKPTHDPATSRGCIKINQPSVFFCVVPVFPATSARMPNAVRTDWPVPWSTAPRSILTKFPTVLGERTRWLWFSNWASTLPFLSVMRVIKIGWRYSPRAARVL